MKIIFTPRAFDQYNSWNDEEEQVFAKIKELIKQTVRDPFKGIGKPEPLKGNYKGFWSRRINQEHRLIYRVAADAIEIVSCKGHYES
ncbi:MAG: Txe/YoeB family addiction module toxin [Chitinophagales bacterium]